MLEGLQVVTHMTLFDVTVPGNVNSFKDFLSEITSFDFFDTNIITELIAYIPEMEAISLNFKNYGFENNLFIPSLKTLFYLLVGHMTLLLPHLLLFLLAKKFKRIESWRDKLSHYLYFNGTLRIFMESYLDLLLCALLNIKDLDWSNNFAMVTASNCFAIFTAVVCFIMPIFMMIQYARLINDWK